METEKISLFEYNMSKIADDIESQRVSDPTVVHLFDCLTICVAYLEKRKNFSKIEDELSEVFK